MQSNGNNTTGENESMVLEEEIDPNYQPTQEEILEYSRYIGIDPETDQDLLYLAKEGLKAPLPADWKPCQNREGKIYYFNFKTKQSQWEHPCDEYYKKLCQEMKRKKQEKSATTKSALKKEKSESRGAFNMPFAKQEVLPLVKNNLAAQPSHQQSLEASFSADNQMFTMNHKMSFSNDQQEYNSITDKKFDGKVLPADFESFQSLGSENNLSSHEDTLNGKEENLGEYKKEKQTDVDKFQRSCREAESKLERQLKQKMERELEDLKTELIANTQNEDCTAIIKEKESIRSNLKSEYKKKAEAGVQKLDKEYSNKKREIGVAESKNVRDNMHHEEEKIKGEFDAKQAALVSEKKKLEVEKEKLRLKEQNSKVRLEEQLEKEKKEVIMDYANLLREAEAEELHAQKQEISEYCMELQEKLAEEKQGLIMARKQKESLDLTRKSELEALYGRRLKLEQENIDNEIVKFLRDFEEKEKKKKDIEIVKLEKMEVAHAKERHQIKLKDDIDQSKRNYNERLLNYQKLLHDKLKKEKLTLEKANGKIIEEYQRGADNIKVNVSTREEIFNQINRAHTMLNKEVQKELTHLEDKIQAQQEENKELQERIQYLQKEEKNRQNFANMVVEEAKKRIKEAENQIVKLTQQKERRNEMPRQKPRPVQKPPKLNSKSISGLGAIKKDLKDIKLFLTKRESVPRPSRREGYESGRASITSRKEYSPKRESVSRYDNQYESYTQRPSLRYNNLVGVNKDWSNILIEEENRIQDQKYNIEMEKRNLKKDHEVLATERESYRRENPVLYSVEGRESNGYREDVKKRKNSLNTQIHDLNRSIVKLRDDQAQIKTKEKSFYYLKQAVEQYENAEIGSSELEAIYNNYQETSLPTKATSRDTRSKSSFDKENRGAILSNRESKRFFQKWRNSLNPGESGESDVESERTENERGSVTQRAYGKENMRSANVSREKVYRKRPSSYRPDTSQAEYSYNNLINVLDMKVKHEAHVTSSSFLQGGTNKVNESRTQATKVFSQHSQWLKDIKDQLNIHLYEKPGKNGTLFMK